MVWAKARKGKVTTMSTSINVNDATLRSIANLHKTILCNRQFGRALTPSDFGGKAMFTAWSNSLSVLQCAVSDLAVAARNGNDAADVSAKRDATFAAWRSVLKFFENVTDDFKIKPTADDEKALLTIAGKITTKHSEPWKIASQKKAAAKEALDEKETPENKAAFAAAKAELDALSQVPGSTWQEYVPYGTAQFRKGLEDMICDRIENRLAKSATEVAAEKKAKNQKRAAERKASGTKSTKTAA